MLSCPSDEEAWGRAVRLAAKSGNQRVLDELHRFVEILDPETGAVRVRANLSHKDIQVVKVVASHYAQSVADPDPAPVAGPSWSCRNCGRTSPASAQFCNQGGHDKPAPAGY